MPSLEAPVSEDHRGSGAQKLRPLPTYPGNGHGKSKEANCILRRLKTFRRSHGHVRDSTCPRLSCDRVTRKISNPSAVQLSMIRLWQHRMSPWMDCLQIWQPRMCSCRTGGLVPLSTNPTDVTRRLWPLH